MTEPQIDPPSSPKPTAPISILAAPLPASAIPTPRLVTVNAINWSNVLDFTHIFRGFRLAINPAKLAIALLAIMLIYTAGRLFDAVWGPQVYSEELRNFVSMTPDAYAGRRSTETERRNNFLDDRLATVSDVTKDQRDALRDRPTAAYRLLKARYVAQFHEAVDQARKNRADRAAAGINAPRIGDTPQRTLAEAEQDERAKAATELQARVDRLKEIVGRGIFDTFLQYETAQFDQLVENTLTFVRVSPVRNSPADTSAVSGGLISRDPERLWRSDTIAGCIANMTITAPRWLFTATAPLQAHATGTEGVSWWGWIKLNATRAWYLLTLSAFAIFSLAILAFAGASISRLSALELAGIERAPLAQVFHFAFRRLWVFIKAPIMPFVILLAFGLIMALVAILGAIPFVGPIIIGAILVLFLLGSFVLMLLMLGIIGGFNLLYPTIAVEGSDAFDAMSRSFAYVYARPWRLLLYTIASLIYGAITFLFVSFAVYLVLLLTHTFVGWGANFFGLHYGAYSGAPLLETLWPSPQFLSLVRPINWYAMSWPEYLGSLLLHFWVFLLITGIGAYVLSYYYSSHTIMYLLLRRSVDGQGLREVYLEEEPLPSSTAPPAITI